MALYAVVMLLYPLSATLVSTRWDHSLTDIYQVNSWNNYLKQDRHCLYNAI